MDFLYVFPIVVYCVYVVKMGRIMLIWVEEQGGTD